MAITLDALKRALSKAIKGAVSARQVIEGKVGEDAAPSSPYVMFSIDGFTPSDFPVTTITGPDDAEIQTVTACAVPVVFLIDVVGGKGSNDAWQDTSNIILNLRLSQRSFDLYAVCGLMGVTNPVNLSALETGSMRSRVQFRITLSAALDLTAEAEIIESIDVTVIEPQRLYDETFTIEQGVNPHGECN